MSRRASSKPLSKEYIQWAIWAYDEGILKWRHMDDATTDAVDYELRKRKRKMQAERRFEDKRFDVWRKEAIGKLMRTHDASSGKSAASHRPLPLSPAPSTLKSCIDASKIEPETLDSSESLLTLEEGEPYSKPSENQKPILEHPKEEIKEVSIFFYPSLSLKMFKPDFIWLSDMSHNPVAYFVSHAYLPEHYKDAKMGIQSLLPGEFAYSWSNLSQVREDDVILPKITFPKITFDHSSLEPSRLLPRLTETPPLTDTISFLGSNATHLVPSCLPYVLSREDTNIPFSQYKKEVFVSRSLMLHFRILQSELHIFKVHLLSCHCILILRANIIYLSGAHAYFIRRIVKGKFKCLNKQKLFDVESFLSRSMLANKIIHVFFVGHLDIGYERSARKRLKKNKCWEIRDDDMTSPRTSLVVLQYGSVDQLADSGSNPSQEREDDVILAASYSIVFKRNQSSRSVLTLLQHLRQFHCAAHLGHLLHPPDQLKSEKLFHQWRPPDQLKFRCDS